MIICTQCEMMVLPVVIVLLALLSDASAQIGTLPRNLTSTFKGLLDYDWGLGESPVKLTEENRAKVQNDVCEQLTYLVPWYRPQRNISICTIVGTDRDRITVNYTIPVTEEFLRTHDPLCSTYYILLANLVRQSESFQRKFYLRDITLENGNSGQPASPSSGDHGSTTIEVDGLVRRVGVGVRRAGFVLDQRVTREVQNNVKRQIVDFLDLSNISDSNILTKPFGDYEDPDFKGFTRMKANITIENSMLAANRINYTCSSFRQLIKACLESRFFYSEATSIGRPVKLLDGKSDGSSSITTTDSPNPDQSTANNGSIVTTSTTRPGGVERMTFRYSSIIAQLFVVFTLAG
ncbi:hypothetical protein EG68_12091 [Paragonimus skrjabini miyazakii]|uniref:Uncharacterized protein n=1 Tax=Paragonimus skrjabini miyazakii TaxID=59628 RepID=A0A8S9YAP4_9TREM|nr:hypothetical protein EG68_12091 [Paragonimus skrjabini miyazakii]